MVKPKARIYGLEEWGVTLSSLRRLGNRQVSVAIGQRGPIQRSLFRFPPTVRQKKLAAFLNRGLKCLQSRFPEVQFRIRGDGALAWTLDAEMPAKYIAALREISSVGNIWIKDISGRCPVRESRKHESVWFAVWGIVAIQIEDQVRGNQSIEDRILLVKASSEEQAKKRLKREWDKYAEPYLNTDGFMVRWKLERIHEVYALFADKIEEKGTEVFSYMRQRRIRPEFEWHPRKGGSRS